MKDEGEEDEEDEDMGVKTVVEEEGETGRGTSSGSVGSLADNPEAVRLRVARLTPQKHYTKLGTLKHREMQNLVEIDMEIMDLEKIHDRYKKINDK